MSKLTIRFFAVILMLITIVLIINSIPKKVEAIYPAVVYSQDDISKVQNINVKISGRLYQPFLFPARYAGSLVIEEYHFTMDYELKDVTFHKRSSGLGKLIYTKAMSDGSQDTIELGQMWVSKNMEKFCIIGAAQPREPQNRMIISAPANTREEAVSITDLWRYK